jgi:SAM-dependent MidA family methyltransferase
MGNFSTETMTDISKQGRLELVTLIADEIRARGPMTFARFMELALYHPQFGYYTSGATRIGKTGDYFTSVSVGPLFGKLLAKQFLQFRDALGAPSEFEVVEFGGHRGELRADVLAVAPELRYRLVEIGDVLPDTITGCVFSNEFLDALPVHRVRAVGGQWREIYVSLPALDSNCHSERSEAFRPPQTDEILHSAQNDFTEIVAPLSSPRLAERLRELPAAALEGYTTEINLRALDWLDDIARRLKRGFVMTIDYGFERAEFFAPHHRDGTLQCYHRHTKNSDPLSRVGEQDITAHVEFTSFIEQGRKAGLEPVTLTDQSRYLLQLGEKEITEIVERTAGQFSKERAAVHQLVHPELMGRAFKVLIQKKV